MCFSSYKYTQHRLELKTQRFVLAVHLKDNCILGAWKRETFGNNTSTTEHKTCSLIYWTLTDVSYQHKEMCELSSNSDWLTDGVQVLAVYLPGWRVSDSLWAVTLVMSACRWSDLWCGSNDSGPVWSDEADIALRAGTRRLSLPNQPAAALSHSGNARLGFLHELWTIFTVSLSQYVTPHTSKLP